MQSSIILALIAIFSIFMLAENSRNNPVIHDYYVFKAENIAANIIQYEDMMTQYTLTNYQKYHLPLSSNPGTVEQLNLIDYSKDNVDKYSQKNLLLFLNYNTITFNYVRATSLSDTPQPVLYMATSWDSYSGQLLSGYSKISLDEVMGHLGSDLSAHLYQGNSTYWVIPWVFKQSGCNITEVFSQLPENSNGVSQLNKLKGAFNTMCNEIQVSSSYKFKTYVFMMPIFYPSDS